MNTIRLEIYNSKTQAANYFIDLTPESKYKYTKNAGQQTNAGWQITLEVGNRSLILIDEHSFYHQQVVV